MTLAGLYGELLDRCLDEFRKAVGLALYPEPPDEGRGASGAYQLPKELLSDRWHRLPVQGSAAGFPAAAGRRIEERLPSVALLVPAFLPPRAVSAHLQAHFPGMGLHEIAVAEALRAMPTDGRLLALVPADLLTASRSPRKLLFAHWQPTIVIVNQDPQRLIPHVHIQFSFALLALEARSASGRLLRMFRVPPLGEVDECQVAADFEALLARQRGRSRFGYVVSEALPPDAPLLFERYDPHVLQRREELAGLGPLRPLEELADLPARLHTSSDRHLLTDGNTGVPVVDGRVVTRTGQLDLSSVRHWADVAPERLPLLQPGDVCVRAIRHPTDGPVPVAVVDASQFPLTASETVVVVRLRPEFRHASSYLAQYLRSPRALELLRAEGLTNHVTAAMLRRLVVPLPDRALLEAHADLRRTIAELDAWRIEAEAAAGSLFYEESPTAARQRLLGVRLVRQRVQAANLLDDLGWRVRTRFPFPVARRWARVQAVADDTDRYASAVEAAEVLLCYAALMAITAAAASGQREPYRRYLQGRLLSRRGFSFGDWYDVLHKAATNKDLQSLPTTIPFREAIDLLTDPEIDATAQRLRHDHRNRASHLGRPTGLALGEASAQATADLQQLLLAAEALADYPLRLVATTRWDSLLSRARVTYWELMGTDTTVPLAQADYPGSGLEADSLYLVDHSGTWHLLRPLLVAQHCTRCNALSTFRPDKYERATGCVTLQSLDHEHDIPSYELDLALRSAGWLP